MSSTSNTADDQKPRCRGCNRFAYVSIDNSLEKAAFICEACKKFHCRYRGRIRDEACNCSDHGQADRTGEKCRVCRFQRIENALTERKGCAPNNPKVLAKSSSIFSPPAKNTDDAAESEQSFADEETSVSAVEKVDFSKLPCAVCGYSSSGFHFGAVTCEGCKGFFRRSVNKTFKIQYTCKGLNGGTDKKLCPASSNCRKCRLQRCYNAGMSLNEISIGRHTLRRRAEIEAAIKKHIRDGSFLEVKMSRRNRSLDHEDFSSNDHDDMNCSTSSVSPTADKVIKAEYHSPNDGNAQHSTQRRETNELYECKPAAPCSNVSLNSSTVMSDSGIRNSPSMEKVLLDSSQWFVDKAVSSAAKLAPISTWRVILYPHYTNEQIVAERVKALDVFSKCVSDFVTDLPGTSQIHISDRVQLFTQCYFPIVCAQLSLHFDVERQLTNHLCLDRQGPSFAMCMAKYEWEGALEDYLVETGNCMASAIKNLKEFALLCSLIYLNPETPNLSNVGLVKSIRARYEIAVLEYFTMQDSSHEEAICRFYRLLSLFRRATPILQEVFVAIWERRPEDRVAWTPLFTQLLSELVKMPPMKNTPASINQSSVYSSKPLINRGLHFQ